MLRCSHTRLRPPHIPHESAVCSDQSAGDLEADVTAWWSSGRRNARGHTARSWFLAVVTTYHLPSGDMWWKQAVYVGCGCIFSRWAAEAAKLLWAGL